MGTNVNGIDIVVKKKCYSSGIATKTCIRAAVDTKSPELAAVAYYEASALPSLLESKKRGEIISIVPVQMLRVQFKGDTEEAATLEAMAKTQVNTSRSNIKNNVA